MTTSKDKYILIVEDEEGFRQLMQQLLENEDYTNVLTAADGEEALQMIKQLGEKLYVITLDITMPKMNGFQVMQHMGKGHKHIVGVVVVTALHEPSGEKKFKELGTENILALQYIRKPFDAEQYLSAIENAIGLVQSKRDQVRQN